MFRNISLCLVKIKEVPCLALSCYFIPTNRILRRFAGVVFRLVNTPHAVNACVRYMM